MMTLGDDGTLDTVIVCSECGTEFRFNASAEDFDPEDTRDDIDRYDDFVACCKRDADAHHICAVGFQYWASYLINGDASGISDDDQRAADAFAKWFGADIVDVTSDSFFDTPAHGSALVGDCVYYIGYTD